MIFGTFTIKGKNKNRIWNLYKITNGRQHTSSFSLFGELRRPFTCSFVLSSDETRSKNEKKSFILPVLSTESFLRYISLPREKNKSILALDISYNRIGVACTDSTRKFIQPTLVLHRHQLNERYKEMMKKKYCKSTTTFLMDRKQEQEIFYYKKAASTLEQLINQYNIGGIVIGWPLEPKTYKPTKQCNVILQIVQGIYRNSVSLEDPKIPKSDEVHCETEHFQQFEPEGKTSHSLKDLSQNKEKIRRSDNDMVLSKTPFTFYDEQYTSVEARKLAKEEFKFKSKKVVDQEDQIAAALILERFLEFEYRQ